MPEIVQEIGAYAGLASVLGLAVLSALYFSQARDVKRLREWAGRAPERLEQGTPAVPGRVVAQPQQPAAPSAPAPPPVPGRPSEPAKPAVAGAAARPAPATPAGHAAPAAAASAAGAGAATAQQGKTQGAPVPAGQNANAGGGAPSTAEPANAGSGPPSTAQAAEPAAQRPAAAAGTVSPAPPSTPPRPADPGPARPAQPTGPGAAPPPRQAAAATPAGGRGAPPGVPSGGGRFSGRPGAPSRQAPQQTAILPPRRDEAWYRRLGPRYVAIMLVGLLALGGAAAYGVTQLTGDDSGGSDRQGAPGNDNAKEDPGQPKREQGGAIKPASVTVAVLNGTTVPGLAATLSDEVGAAGFKVGTITNFSDQQLAESVVQYAPGHQAEARAVSRRLGIDQREPVNPSSQALAGDATVIVIAGADKAP